MTQEKKRGWGLPQGSRKWHYFVGSLSLCRKYGFFKGHLEEGDDSSPDNCAQCKKIVLKDKESSS